MPVIPKRDIVSVDHQIKFLFTFFISLITNSICAQEPATTSLLNDLLESKSQAEEIQIFQLDGYPKMLFWPS